MISFFYILLLSLGLSTNSNDNLVGSTLNFKTGGGDTWDDTGSGGGDTWDDTGSGGGDTWDDTGSGGGDTWDDTLL